MSGVVPEHCDVLVVGAGPAGMAAAVAAARSGASIAVIDDNPAPGGQIWRDGPGAKLPPAARKWREALERHANIRVRSGTRVVAAPSPGELLLEDADGAVRMRWGRLILCTGARELLLPFPGWTLPGVTGAGGLQALVKAGLPVEGERIVVAGSGPLLLAAAATARSAGAKVLRIAEQASFAAVARFGASLARWPGKAAQAVALADPCYRTSSHVVSAGGAVPFSALQDCSGWTDAKLHRRCGMGACQGRVCGDAAQFLFGWTPPAPRPPLSPVRIATLAGLAEIESTGADARQ